MSTWDFRQLQQNIDKKRLPNLVLLFGEEDYLCLQSLRLIKKSVVAESTEDFNYDQYFAGDVQTAKVVDSVEQLPMMSERRLVIFRAVDKLKEKDWKQLEPLLENPLPTTCFVLVADKIDKRKKFAKSVAKNGQLVEFKRPYDNQVAAWVDYIAHQHNLKISREGVGLIHQLVGNNLGDIDAEITKLSQFLGDKAEATSEDILKVVSKLRIDSVFDLTDAIGRKDRAAALTYLANLLDHGQNEIAALALIHRHVRILSTLNEGMKQGLRGQKLSTKAGVPNFFLNKYLNQCRSWNEGQIKKTVNALYETDKALKSSSVSSHIWLENFILQTCS